MSGRRGHLNDGRFITAHGAATPLRRSCFPMARPRIRPLPQSLLPSSLCSSRPARCLVGAARPSGRAASPVGSACVRPPIHGRGVPGPPSASPRLLFGCAPRGRSLAIRARSLFSRGALTAGRLPPLLRSRVLWLRPVVASPPLRLLRRTTPIGSIAHALSGFHRSI